MQKFLKLPLLDHFSSRKQWEEACWKIISKSKESLDVLTTSYERRNIILRAAALSYLDLGKKSKQIAEELWLSPQTISSIKKITSGHFYKSYWERGKSDRKRKIYSSSFSKKEKPQGRPTKTKYGVVYLP